MKNIGKYFYFIVLSLLLMEGITYRGFLKNKLGISTDQIIFLFAIFGLLIDWVKIKKTVISKIAIYAIVFWVSLFILESVTYPNFVFSKFHINLDSSSIFIASLSILLVMQNIKKQNIFVSLALFISVFYIFSEFQRVFVSGVGRNKFEIKNLSMTYDEKMAKEYGIDYYFYKFVMEKTLPSDTVIIPPQQEPWIHTGNALLSRYFLTPRNLINGNLTNIASLSAEYVTVSNESDPNHGSGIWPDFDIKTNKVYVFDPVNNTSFETDNYDLDYFKENNYWGLIKLK